MQRFSIILWINAFSYWFLPYVLYPVTISSGVLFLTQLLVLPVKMDREGFLPSVQYIKLIVIYDCGLLNSKHNIVNELPIPDGWPACSTNTLLTATNWLILSLLLNIQKLMKWRSANQQWSISIIYQPLTKQSNKYLSSTSEIQTKLSRHLPYLWINTYESNAFRNWCQWNRQDKLLLALLRLHLYISEKTHLDIKIGRSNNMTFPGLRGRHIIIFWQLFPVAIQLASVCDPLLAPSCLAFFSGYNDIRAVKRFPLIPSVFCMFQFL